MTTIDTKNWHYLFKSDEYWIYRGYVNMLDYPFLDSNDYIDVRKSKYTTQIMCGKGDDIVYGSKNHMNFLYGDIPYEVFGKASDNVNYLTISGDDKIYGGKSTDYINAGPGADTINAGKGTNVIMFKQGDGNDTIIQAKGKDYLFFVDTEFNNIDYERIGADLKIIYGTKNDEIVVENYFKNIKKSSLKGVADMNTMLGDVKQAFRAFYDTTEKQGIKILKRALLQTRTITSFLSEKEYINTKMTVLGKFSGTDYNDYIIGTSEDDNITAKKGNDKINAGGGVNYIYFSKKDGNDIVEDGGGNDILVFSKIKKISKINFELSNDLKDLIISYSGNDSVTIKDYSDTHSVQQIKLGKKLYDISNMIDIKLNMVSNSFNDNLCSMNLDYNDLTAEVAAFSCEKKSDISLNYDFIENTDIITPIIAEYIKE